MNMACTGGLQRAGEFDRELAEALHHSVLQILLTGDPGGRSAVPCAWVTTRGGARTSPLPCLYRRITYDHR